MPQPTAEEGVAFLAENKTKEGVITLASGLQYKVLEEGPGLEHPAVGTPCECHYAGRLIDGTEFDSSYKRGQPTTFAPNQVIKGWTEAMQLMVQGDKWEMYIPMELAYGPGGKPPKIPPAAALVFIMEIVKIKGKDTTPWKGTFPTWTPEEEALWLQKDIDACESWRAGRAAKWEAGDETLKASYPTREALDEWMEKTSTNSKNKSLWKRTRTEKKKAAAAAAEGGAGGAAPGKPAALTAETGRSLLDKALSTFKEPANKEELLGIVRECDAAAGDSGTAAMQKMMKLMPAVSKMLGPTLTEFGFGADDLMPVAMQLQAFDEPSIKADVSKLMKAVTEGDVTGLL